MLVCEWFFKPIYFAFKNVVNKIVFFVWNQVVTLKMADVDPETLLEWLQMGQGEERDMQLIALEQLCMLLLMSDNVDRCFERWVVVVYTLPLPQLNEMLLLSSDKWSPGHCQWILSTGLHAMFLKGQGHQGISSLLKGTRWENCKIILSLGHFKGSRQWRGGMEAKKSIASTPPGHCLCALEMPWP